MSSDRRQLYIDVTNFRGMEMGQIVYGPMTAAEVDGEHGWQVALKDLLHPEDRNERKFVRRMYDLAYRKWNMMEVRSKTMWDRFVRSKIFIAVPKCMEIYDAEPDPFRLPHCEEYVREGMEEGRFYKYGPLYINGEKGFEIGGYHRRHVIFDFMKWLDHFTDWLEPGKECGNGSGK